MSLIIYNHSRFSKANEKQEHRNSTTLFHYIPTLISALVLSVTSIRNSGDFPLSGLTSRFKISKHQVKVIESPFNHCQKKREPYLASNFKTSDYRNNIL